MARMFTTAGSKLEIGGPLDFSGADLTTSSFTSQTWVEITGITDMGTAGDTSQLVTSDQIGSARTRKGKGTRNAGSMSVVADLDYADAGQIALIAAEKAPGSYAFRITFDDAPAGANAKPSQRLFVAFVMSTAEAMGGANNVQQLNATLEIDSNIVRVAATAS